MSVEIENIPQPEILMNSLRSIGYSFNTAIADVLDNSIAADAHHIWIYFPPNDREEPYISILDDGFGMNDAELLNAMKYGSEREEYGDFDLGRFGLGLKSASLSQCRILTVLSKKDGIVYGYRWDLDEVIKTKKWICLKLVSDEINKCPGFNSLSALDSGTLVIWQNFDFANDKDYSEVYKELSVQIDSCENHICLIYHRFMNRKQSPVVFYINDRELVGLDPFLEGTSQHTRNPKVDIGKVVEMSVPYTENGEKHKTQIKIQTCILPHQDDLTDGDLEALGGIESMKDNQGFFIYRNDRLIIYGTWFKLSSRGINPELYKYGRIRVDIPNKLDFLWGIDIKKQNAVIPREILKLLKKSVSEICTGSRKKTEKRSRLANDDCPESIWRKVEYREKDLFCVNLNSQFIRNCLDSFEDKEKSRVIRMLEVVSSCVPYEDIYVSRCNGKIENDITPDVEESCIILGFEQFKLIREVNQCSKETAFKKLVSVPPFSENQQMTEKLRRKIFDDNG